MDCAPSPPTVAASTTPSTSETDACVGILRRLSPSDLDLPWAAELRTAGLQLFSRAANKEAFGSKDVVAFLAEQHKHKKTLAELKKLEAVVRGTHRRERIQAHECGMNEARKQQLELIKNECLKMAEENSMPRIEEVDRSHQTAMTVTLALVPDSPRCERLTLQVNASAAGALASSLPSPYGVWSGLGGGHQSAAEEQNLPPEGDLRRICNVCRGDFTHERRHHFYHQLCLRCGDFNLNKRHQTADMQGLVALVTGGRVRIGYATVLKLLRAGAAVYTTTRFPNDAAHRYAQEEDFGEWAHRLSVVGPLELSNIRLVEAFCDALLASLPRLDVLINNAAQTLTRPAGWQLRMGQLEARAASALSPQAEALLRSPIRLRIGHGHGGEAAAAAASAAAAGLRVHGTEIVGGSSGGAASLGGADASGGRAATALESSNSLQMCHDEAASLLAAFPAHHLDESRQPLDLSGVNSWSRRLGEIETLEMVQTLAANAAAPFILCNRLAPLLRGNAGGLPSGHCSHVINVTAVEGKFSVGKKSHAHPHTNMGKAALNMLTFTSAQSFYQQYRVLMNSVDTGWVTDMAPGAVGVTSARHATWVGPPLDEVDGAARVLDPIFCHLKDPKKWLIKGYCFRNFFVAGW